MFAEFKKARSHVRKLKLRNVNEWRKYCKSGNKSNDIPSNPHRRYKNEGRISVGDWLGTKAVHPSKINWMPFEKARKVIHDLKLKNTIQWNEYCKSGEKHKEIPSHPEKVYSEWVDFKDWLGDSYKGIRHHKRGFHWTM